MRNPKRINGIIDHVKKIWKKYPELRLGQLLGNASDELTLYYIEDDELIVRLELFHKKMLESKKSDY